MSGNLPMEKSDLMNINDTLLTLRRDLPMAKALLMNIKSQICIIVG